MKFGELKTIVENKLVDSFIKNELKSDLKVFNKIIKEDKSFGKMMMKYDSLLENKGYDKDVATFMFDEIISDLKSITLKESTIQTILKWSKGIQCENKYSDIDEFITSDDFEKKFKIKKGIVEGLSKKPKIKESVKLPISSLVKVANNTIKKHLDTLNESDREKVMEVLKSEDILKEKFKELKENTISTINSMISESDESVKSTLSETVKKIENTEFSKKEYVKLLTLNEGLKK